MQNRQPTTDNRPMQEQESSLSSTPCGQNGLAEDRAQFAGLRKKNSGEVVVRRHLRSVNHSEPLSRLATFLQSNAELMDKVRPAFRSPCFLVVCSNRRPRLDNLAAYMSACRIFWQTRSHSDDLHRKIEQTVGKVVSSHIPLTGFRLSVLHLSMPRQGITNRARGRSLPTGGRCGRPATRARN